MNGRATIVDKQELDRLNIALSLHYTDDNSKLLQGILSRRRRGVCPLSARPEVLEPLGCQDDHAHQEHTADFRPTVLIVEATPLLFDHRYLGPSSSASFGPEPVTSWTCLERRLSLRLQSRQLLPPLNNQPTSPGTVHGLHRLCLERAWPVLAAR